MLSLIHICSYTPEFDERYRTIAEEINALKEAQKTARNEKRMADSYEQRIQDIDHYLSTTLITGIRDFWEATRGAPSFG